MHPQPRREPPHAEKDALASGRTAAGERLRLLELAAEHVDDVILISEAEPIDLPGPRVLYVNAAFSRMTGYAPEEIIGKTPRLLQGPGTSQETRAFIRERLSRWERFTCELLNYRKDGGEFWVELSVTPVADENGWYTHWVAIQRDVTARKREEHLRNEVLSRYELAVAGSQSGVWSWNVETGERYRSDHWKSILGYAGPFEAEAPDDPAAVIHPEDLARREVKLNPPFLRGDAPDFAWEYRARHRDGSWRWMESRARAERDAEGRAIRVAGIYSDITERKGEEERRRERAERDRRVAEVLQATVLPPLPERPVPGLLVGGFHEPASDEAAVGGDFYDCFPLPGGRVALVVGDVIGHGLAAALSIAEVRFALRGFLSEDGLDDPSAALRRLNRFLVESNELQHQWGSASEAVAKARPRNSLVALTLAVLDPPTGGLLLATAGMEPALVVRVGGDAVVETLDAGDLILGATRGVEYAAVRATLAPGDVLAITTDGLTEARPDGGAGQFALDGLGRALGASAALACCDIQRAGREAVAAARDFAGGSFRDDICLLLACRPEG